MSFLGGLADAIGGIFGGDRGDGRDAGRGSGVSNGGFQGRSNMSAADVAAAAAASSGGPGRAAGGYSGFGSPGEGRAELLKGVRAVAPVAPAVAPGEAKGARPVEEGTGQGASARARRLGLASTIATTPGGLLAAEGATRQRRSLMSGGLIR